MKLTPVLFTKFTPVLSDYVIKRLHSLSLRGINCRKLISCCFKPSQLRTIISGLRETFIERCIIETTNKAELRPEEQSKKADVCRENLWNEIQLKGSYRQKQTLEQNKKKSGQARSKPQHPHHDLATAIFNEKCTNYFERSQQLLLFLVHNFHQIFIMKLKLSVRETRPTHCRRNANQARPTVDKIHSS